MFSGWDGVDVELNQTSFDGKSSAKNIVRLKTIFQYMIVNVIIYDCKLYDISLSYLSLSHIVNIIVNDSK